MKVLHKVDHKVAERVIMRDEMRDFTNNNADTKKKTLDRPPETTRKGKRGFGVALELFQASSTSGGFMEKTGAKYTSKLKEYLK